jgi:heptosyltransferase-2
MNIAVILPRWVGDSCMATPLLRGLRVHFGTRARITGVMRPIVAELLAGTDWLDGTIAYDRHKKDPALGFKAAARALRSLRPDVTLVLPGSLSAAALAFRGGGRTRVGFAGTFRRLLLTDVLPVPREGRKRQVVPPPVAYLAIGAAIGLPPQPLQLELGTTREDERCAETVLSGLFPGRDPGGGDPLVVLNDNSSNGTARAWGVANHAALSRWLVERVPGACVLVHCGPGDREQARAIVAQAAHPSVAGLGDVSELPLGLSKAVYRRAALAITSDSGPRHIGAAFGVPTVVLLGPTDPLLGRSDEPRCVEVRKSLVCSPCNESVCPLGHHDCMRLITVEEVGRAALAAIARHGSIMA